MFQQTSFFNVLPSKKTKTEQQEEPAKTITLTPKQLEDWAHKIQGAAYEAGDRGLGVVESNLLDLRDDIVFEIHNGMLNS